MYTGDAETIQSTGKTYTVNNLSKYKKIYVFNQFGATKVMYTDNTRSETFNVTFVANSKIYLAIYTIRIDKSNNQIICTNPMTIEMGTSISAQTTDAWGITQVYGIGDAES